MLLIMLAGMITFLFIYALFSDIHGQSAPLRVTKQTGEIDPRALQIIVDDIYRLLSDTIQIHYGVSAYSNTSDTKDTIYFDPKFYDANYSFTFSIRFNQGPDWYETFCLSGGDDQDWFITDKNDSSVIVTRDVTGASCLDSIEYIAIGKKDQ